jgi:vacuolar iron transporter family protein
MKRFRGVVRDFVFGMEDGLVSNLGLVLGVYVGGGSQFAVILAGLASMFAGAFSMSAGSYLSSKSQREVYECEIKETQKALEKSPKKYLKEMKKVLKSEGFDEDEIGALLHHFEHHNKSTFFTNYIQKKVGISKEKFDHPLKNAGTMFVSFLFSSIVPIAPFFFGANHKVAAISVILTVCALFLVGWVKTIFTKRNWLKSGLEIALVGIAAGFIGYLIGWLVSLLA